MSALNDALAAVAAEMRETIAMREMCQGVTAHSRKIAEWADRIEQVLANLEPKS